MKINLPRPWKKVLCFLEDCGWTVGYRDEVRGQGNTTWHYDNRLLGSTYRGSDYWVSLPPKPKGDKDAE